MHRSLEYRVSFAAPETGTNTSLATGHLSRQMQLTMRVRLLPNTRISVTIINSRIWVKRNKKKVLAPIYLSFYSCVMCFVSHPSHSQSHTFCFNYSEIIVMALNHHASGRPMRCFYSSQLPLGPFAFVSNTHVCEDLFPFNVNTFPWKSPQVRT